MCAYFSNIVQYIRYPRANQSNSLCSCQYSIDCVYPAGIYNNLMGADALVEYGRLQSSHVPNATLQGMLVGCFPMNVLLQSTLQCLFNSTCLLVLQSALPAGRYSTVAPLFVKSSSQFSMEMTVQAIMDQIFVDEWKDTSNYSAFYEQCQPNFCTYSYVATASVANLVTAIISLFGGLVIALKLLSSVMVKVGQLTLEQIRKKRSRNPSIIGNAAVRKWIESSFQRIGNVANQ